MNDFKWIKPKSKDKIDELLSNLTLEEKFKMAIDNNCMWLVKECVKNGVDIDRFHLTCYRISAETQSPIYIVIS